jgi:hypothetical protein
MNQNSLQRSRYALLVASLILAQSAVGGNDSSYPRERTNSAHRVVEPSNRSVALEIRMDTNSFFLGKPVACLISLTNKSDRPVGFLLQYARDPDSSGLVVEVVDESRGSMAEPLGDRYGALGYKVEPGGQASCYRDLTRLCRLDKPGRYRVRATYYSRGWEGSQSITFFILQTDWTQFAIVEDEESRREIVRLRAVFQRGKSAELQAELVALPSKSSATLRGVADMIVPLVAEHDTATSRLSRRLILSRIRDFEMRQAAEQICELLIRETASDNVETRLETLGLLEEMRPLWACSDDSWMGTRLWKKLFVENMRIWFARESSPECRMYLVRMVGFNVPELVRLIDNDPEPGVKLAAVEYWQTVAPESFLRRAVQFTNRTEVVAIDSKRMHLGQSVLQECDGKTMTLGAYIDRRIDYMLNEDGWRKTMQPKAVKRDSGN